MARSMRKLTLTHEELCNIRSQVCYAFLDVEESQTRLNSSGSIRKGREGNELLLYVYLLEDICFPSEYTDDTYSSILTNKDIFKIHNRALSIRSNIKRITN